jgi:hypothetical protein
VGPRHDGEVHGVVTDDGAVVVFQLRPITDVKC